MLNRAVTPIVPSQGSVGASGDLAPLAHLALALIGEGQCFDEKGVRLASAEALRRTQIRPLVLEAKEAVSLLNGTQGMLAVGVLTLLAAETLVDSADVIGALTLDALRGTDVAFDERIHKVRPHSGQLTTAAHLRKMLEGSQLRESHRDCARVQDAYSLRCMPQVHGAVRDTLAHCREVMEIEVNSAIDKPLAFPAYSKARVRGFNPNVGQQRRLRFHGYDGRAEAQAHRREPAQWHGHRGHGRRSGTGFSGATQDLQARPGGACRHPLGLSRHG